MILTSGHNQQFGISLSHADEVVSSIVNSESLSFSGVHVHIGSQIRDPNRYKLAMNECGSFLKRHEENIDDVPILNAGGGFFSPYAGDDYDEELIVYSESIKQGINESWGKEFKLMIEPGRAVVNNPGIIIYSTGAIKYDRGEKPYILVNGGMSDNPRPALYGSEHKLFNISNLSEDKITFAISGRHCESGDLLVENAELPRDTKQGDVLMSTSTGAYTYSMASNYNRVPKSGVVAISKNYASIIIKNQSFGDTALNDV
jgi:diaminopimelate decarboxylase